MFSSISSCFVVLIRFKYFSPSVVLGAVEAILDSAEQQARQVISEWPDGEYRGEAKLDDDGHGRVDVTIRAS